MANLPAHVVEDMKRVARQMWGKDDHVEELINALTEDQSQQIVAIYRAFDEGMEGTGKDFKDVQRRIEEIDAKTSMLRGFLKEDERGEQ